MKIKTLLAVALSIGFHQAWAAPAIPDTITVDSLYSKETNSVTLPIVDLEAGRYSSKLSFDTFVRQADGSYLYLVTATPMVSLNDANDIVMDPGFDPVIAGKLKAFLEKHIVDVSKGGLGKPGVIVRVDMNGKVWRGVIGKKRVNSDEALNFSDRHRIGSLSKTFVDNVVMQLVDQGLLKLDATIDTYIPDVVIPNKNKITVRDLIAHRSGLYNYVVDPTFTGIQKALAVDPLKVYKPSDLLAIANSQPVNYDPDPKAPRYQYTNTGLILAGLIIEKVTGKPIIQAVHDYTVKRLGLMRTEFPKDSGIQSNYMHGHADYNNDGKLSSYNGNEKQAPWIDPNNGNTVPAFPAQEIVSYLDPSVSWAAGALVSNQDDLAKWIKAYVDGDLLKDKTLQSQVLNDCLPSAPDYGASYCLGLVKITWPFNTSNPSQWWYGHLGQIQGYDNAVFRNPSKNITVGMVNNNYFISTDANLGTGILIFELLNIVDPQSSATTAKTANARIPLPPLNPEDLGGQ
ncbi:serine hydrolase domain-containing protein [Candidatus Methylobacter oryzae]|uniref:Beta-lactamase family protein n=1 Tax=Candidatus Methylobacter oryzae TaxID=2497749 RepID=A0ABY3C681_9GAMM|nr:serine hydrolase domain-containing protein [Candidatus Methylobacter oryzae]TRW90366.1 beta-lactamase family protein [Candidatus Methylobacter oryzae]